MRLIRALCLLLLVGIIPAFAAQQPVFCAPNVACTNGGPKNTTTGDLPPVAFSKLNANDAEEYSNIASLQSGLAATNSNVTNISNSIGANTIPAGLSVSQLNIRYPATNYAVNTTYATTDAGLVQGNGSTWVQGTQFVLMQTGVDFIFLPSGTMSNNCSFTVPALDQVYSNAYAYFGPGAIAASSNPGWYFVIMTSTTAGTCYQNQYSFGQPVIPATPTAFSTTGPGAWTALVNTGIPGPNVNIPPFSPGLNGQINIKASWTSSNTTTGKILAFIYGGTNTGSDTETNVSPTNISTARTITNRGQTGAQVTTGTNSNGTLTGPNFETIDGTVNQTLWATFNRATAATDWMVLHSLSIDLKPAGALDAPAAQQIPVGSATVAPPCAAAFGLNVNKWYIQPTAASVSLTTNTTSPLFLAAGQSAAHISTVNGMLSLNQLGDGVNVGVDSINNNNIAGSLSTLSSAQGFYIEGGLRLTVANHDAWPAIYGNPIEKFISSSQPYVEIDGDEQIGAISSNIPFWGSTNSTLDWPNGSGGSAVTANNLNQGAEGFSLDRTQWHTFGFGYDPVSKHTFYCLDGTKQPFSPSTAGFDSDINAYHYFLILNASSHGLHVPYSMQVSYLSAWSSQ